MQAVHEDEKVCTRCGHTKPHSQFKRRSKAQGQRLSWCRDCVNESARQLTARKRAAIVGTAAKYVRHNTPASRVEATVAAACRRAGGVERFAEQIVNSLESRNPIIAFNAAKLFLNLLAARERLRADL